MIPFAGYGDFLRIYEAERQRRAEEKAQKRFFEQNVPNFSNISPQQMYSPQISIPTMTDPEPESVVGSLSGGGGEVKARTKQGIKKKEEPETGWQKALRTIGEASQSEWYKMLGDFLVGAGQASAGGGFGEALQKGAMGLAQGIEERNKENTTINMLKDMGYTEEQARGIAANPQMLKDVLNVSAKGQGIDIDYAKGVINTVDERGVPLQIPIQGSVGYKLLLDDKRATEVAANHYNSVNNNIKNLVNKMVEVIKSSPNFATGGLLTPIAKLLSGTAASQLAKFQKSLEANLALNEMKKLRDMSPTGAHGLGQLTVEEYKGLASVQGALSQDLKAGEYLQQLENILKSWNQFYSDQVNLNNKLRAHLAKRIQLSENYTRAGGIGSAPAPQQQEGGESAPKVILQDGVEYFVTSRGNIPIVDSEENAKNLPEGSEYINRRTGAVHIRG